MSTVNVTFQYELDGQSYEETIPCVGDYSLEFFDTCIQNRIQTKRAALDRKAKADAIQSNFWDLIGKKIDYAAQQDLLDAIAKDQQG